MYKKKIKIKGKKYLYYYHNIKLNGKVKNIYLGSSKKEALEKLDKIKEDRLNEELLKNAPSPNYEFQNDFVNENLKKLFLFLLIILLGISFFNNYNFITGFIVYQPSNLQSPNNTFIPSLTPTLSWTNSTGGNENNTYILDISNNITN